MNQTTSDAGSRPSHPHLHLLRSSLRLPCYSHSSPPPGSSKYPYSLSNSQSPDSRRSSSSGGKSEVLFPSLQPCTLLTRQSPENVPSISGHHEPKRDQTRQKNS